MTDMIQQSNPQSNSNVQPSDPTVNPQPLAPGAGQTPPSQPNPSGQPPAQPQGGQPPVTHTPTTPAASLHARLYDGILKTLSGGPIRVMQTDPQTGESKMVEQPQSRTSMGKSILAGVLTGMFSGGNSMSPGAGGVPAFDPAKGLANGFNAEKQAQQQKQQGAQKLSDDALSRKLSITQNNIKLAQQASAMALQQHKVLGDVVQNNQDTILKDAEEWDSQQDGTDPSTKAILGKGLDVNQAMNALKGNMTSQNAFIDGTVSVRNPKTGVVEEHPTYTILNPDVKIKLSKQTSDTLAKYNKQYQDAYEVTGGNVSVPLRSAISAMHEANTLTSVQDFMNNAITGLSGGEPTQVDLAAAVKNDRTLLPAIDNAEKAMAAGGNTANVLDAVRKAPNGNKLIAALGVTPEAVDQYIRDSRNQATEEESEAKSGGKIAIEKAKSAKNTEMIKETAQNILANPNNMASIEKITSLRGDNRTELFNELEEQSGGTYNIEDAKAKAKTYESFTQADGKDRTQIESYNTFLKHDAAFVNTIGSFMRPGNTPYWIDKPLNWIEQYAGSDPDILEFKARMVPVKSEFINFMKANHAALEEDVNEMNQLVDFNQSPRALLRVAQTLGDTGMDRLDSKNATYKQNFGSNYPNLFDARGASAAAKLGMADRLKEYGITPPSSSGSSNTPNADTDNPAQRKQQVLSSITFPDGSHPKDVKFGPNNTMIVLDPTGKQWVDPVTMKPPVTK